MVFLKLENEMLLNEYFIFFEIAMLFFLKIKKERREPNINQFYQKYLNLYEKDTHKTFIQSNT